MNFKDLLNTSGSLTQALREKVGPLTLQILDQAFRKARPEEIAVLDDTTLWQRDIFLCHDKIPMIFASTRVAKTTFDALPILQQLNDKPLGDWLFQQNPIKKYIHYLNDDEINAILRKMPYNLPPHLSPAREIHYELNSHLIWIIEIFLETSK